MVSIVQSLRKDPNMSPKILKPDLQAIGMVQASSVQSCLNTLHILDNFKRFVVSDLFAFLRDSASFASPLPPYCTIQETLYVFPVYFDVMDISIQKHIKNNCTVQTEKKQSLSRTWSDTISKKGNCTYHSLQHQFIQ